MTETASIRKHGQYFATDSLVETVQSCETEQSVQLTFETDNGLTVSKRGTIRKIDETGSSIDLWFNTDNPISAYLHVNRKTGDMYFESGDRKRVEYKLVSLKVY